MKIGLEIHVALPTKSKLFCSCSVDAEKPNSSICPICMGFPGSKPMLNEEAVRAAMGIANALHCEINNKISFVRKIYFYPDLPKSYQITQVEGAIGNSGYLQTESWKVRIRRVQIEEDPAKIVREQSYTLLDFNRCGMPLTEIITEPDIKSEKELWSFLRTLRSVLYYLGVDINRELKTDLNISLEETRVEVKNITGIKNLVEATQYEVERQTELIKEGSPIARETRGYNEKRKATESMREKETDEEYGYLFEPDLTIFDIGGLDYKKTVYTNEVAAAYGKKYKTRAETINELIMFDRNALAIIENFKDKYPMQAIVNSVEKTAKYGTSDMPLEKYRKLLDLIMKDAVITQKIIDDIVANKNVSVKFKDINDEELDAAIIKFVSSKSGMLADYEKNRKVFNYVVGNIAKEHNLHPKRVSERLERLLKKGELK